MSMRSDTPLAQAIESLRYQGYAIVPDVVPPQLLAQTRAALYHAKAEVESRVGEDRLRRAGERGVVRIPFLFDDVFYRYLELPEALHVADQVVGETSILHLMNGFVLPSETPSGNAIFQQTFHPDFPRYLNGYVASVNVFVAVDAFTPENGATLVVPGTHQRSSAPDVEYMRANAVPVCANAGSLLLFDSTLWHAAGINTSGKDRLAINMQFTKSWIKQQIDYVRAIGEQKLETLAPRTQQLLGWYTRVVTSLDEYYQPEEKRLYRRGQG